MKHARGYGLAILVTILVLSVIGSSLIMHGVDGQAVQRASEWIGVVDTEVSRSTAVEGALPPVPRRENVSIRPSYPISVLVRERYSGRPVPSAHVTALTDFRDEGVHRAGGRVDPVDALVDSMTDSLGSASLELPRDGVYDIVVTHDQFGSRVVHDCFVGADVVVELEPSGRVFGRVTWDGEGVDGARLTIRPSGSLPMRARTEVGGRFSVPGVPSGEVAITVSTDVAASYASARRRLDPGGQLEFEITLQPGVNLDGIIEDAATGLPVPKAEVGCSWAFDPSVLTAEDGRFSIRNVRSNEFSTYQLYVRAEGYAQTSRYVTLPLPSGFTISLSRGHRVWGRVEGRTNAVIETERVRVVLAMTRTSHSSRSPGVVRSARPDRDGWFEFQNVDSGSYTLLIYAPIGAMSFQLPPFRSDLNLGSIAMDRGVTLTGHVRSEEGAPMSGVEVFLEGWTDGVFVYGRGKGETGDIPEKIRLRVRSDRTGAFRFCGVADGQYDMVVREGGLFGRQVDVHGYDLSKIEIRVPTPALISGSVWTNIGDVELSNCRVAAQNADGSLTTAGVDADGSFQIDGLREGVYRIVGLRSPSGTAFVPVDHVPSNTRGVRLFLDAAATVEGTVHDQDGSPIRAAIWRRIGGGPAMAAAESDEVGRFVMYVEPGFSGEIWARAVRSAGRSGTRLVAAGDREVRLVSK